MLSMVNNMFGTLNNNKNTVSTCNTFRIVSNSIHIVSAPTVFITIISYREVPGPNTSHDGFHCVCDALCGEGQYKAVRDLGEAFGLHALFGE